MTELNDVELLQVSSPDQALAGATSRGPRRFHLALFDRILGSLTLIVLTSGFGISIWQTSQLRASINHEKLHVVQEDTREVNKIFVEKPYLQKYFLSGVDIGPQDPHYDEAFAVAVLLLSNIDLTSFEAAGDKAMFEPGPWERYYRFQFGASPLLCRLAKQDADIYGDEAGKLAFKYCRPLPPRPLNPH